MTAAGPGDPLEQRVRLYETLLQVTPDRLLELNMDPDPAKAGRVM